jgi:hypothetical protein
MGQRFAAGNAMSVPDTVVRELWIARREAVETAMVGTQLLGVRIALSARYLPVLALLYAVGAAEGWSRRARRRDAADRESAGLYHRAKLLQVALLMLGVIGVWLWPRPVAWSSCAGFGAVATGLLASVQWAYYRKFL